MRDWYNKNVLKVLLFYNILIDFMKQPKVKKLTNVELLNELPFYSSLGFKEVSEAFKRYAKSFNIEIINREDPLAQLYSSKSCIKDLFKVLLCEMKGFKYQVTMNATLRKQKINGDTKYANVYFNSFVKIVINYDFEHLINKSFDEILYRIDNWINDGSGWMIDLINSEYLNISVYVPVLGSNFIELPSELNHPKKGLINIRNNDDKRFLWCHVRHLNLVDNHCTRVSREDKRIADTLDYSDVTFPVSSKDYDKIENKNGICINVFSYEGNIIYPIYVSGKVSDCMNVLMIHEGDKSHYVYIKDFNRLMFNKTRHKNKEWFCMRCLQCFSSKNILNKHKENCLVINGEQRVKLNEGFICFKNYSRQMKVPFKIYADFECI